MTSIKTLATFFGWCTVINFGFILVVLTVVGVFHDRMHPSKQAWIELYGLLLLFFPFVVMILWFSVPFIQYSFEISEISDAPGGLPYRWAIKSVLPISMLLLLVAGISRLLRVSCLLFDHPRSIDANESGNVD